MANKATTVYTVSVPQTMTWQTTSAISAIIHLFKVDNTLSFRINMSDVGIFVWQLVARNPKYDVQKIVQALLPFYPDVEVKVEPYSLTPQSYPFFRATRIFIPPDIEDPFIKIIDFSKRDPLNALLYVMKNGIPGERMEYVLLNDGPAPIETTAHWILRGMGGTNDNKIRAHSRGNGFRFCIAVQIDGPDPQRLPILHELVRTFFREQFGPNPLYSLYPLCNRPPQPITNEAEDNETLALGVFSTWKKARVDTWASRFFERQDFLVPAEVAALWHLPNETITYERIEWTTSMTGELPKEIVGGKDGVQLGTGMYRRREEPVYLKDTDRRTHMSVLGGTGTGKSTFLHNLVHQDIAQGKGVAVIDPHGTLIEAILQQSIPPEREQDVVVIDLSQHEYPPPLNPFRGGGEYGNAGRILRAVEMASGTGNYARLKKFLQAAVQTVGVDPNATMRDLSRVFRENDYRSNLLEKVDSPILDETWGDYEQYNQTTREGVRDPVLSRINPFYGNPLLYPIFCHRNGLDFVDHIRHQRIILISLDLDTRTVSKEEEEMIGALLIAQLQLAGMEQKVDATRPPFYIYIDEVERFVNDTLDTILNEARKRGLSLILAHQYLHQIKGNLLKSVMANVDTRIVFRCSLEDAKEFTPYMGREFADEDIITLSNYQAFVKMQHTPKPGSSPISLPGFGIRTLEPVPLPTDAQVRATRIRRLSIQNYTPMSASAVKEWLDKRYPRKRPPSSEEQDYYE